MSSGADRVCNTCHLSVEASRAVIVEPLAFHRSCFRCHSCALILPLSSFRLHEGTLYCPVHQAAVLARTPPAFFPASAADAVLVLYYAKEELYIAPAHLEMAAAPKTRSPMVPRPPEPAKEGEPAWKAIAEERRKLNDKRSEEYAERLAKQLTTGSPAGSVSRSPEPQPVADSAKINAESEAERMTKEQEAKKNAQDEAERRQQEAAAKQAREDADRQDAERQVREETARREIDRIAMEEADRIMGTEAERKARADAEGRALEDEARKAKEDADRRAKEEAERKAKEDFDRRAEADRRGAERREAEARAAETARAEADSKAKEDAERKASEDAERRESEARAEAVRKFKEETDRKAIEEVERAEVARKAKEEADRKTEADRVEAARKEDTDRKARNEVEKKAKEDADLKARQDAERKAKEEAELTAKQEADRVAREQADRKAKEDEEAMREAAKLKATQEAERKAKEEAEKKAREAAARFVQEEAAAKAREEMLRREKEAAERKVKEEAEKKSLAEAAAKAREDGAKRAREEVVRKAAEMAARKTAERQALAEAEEKAREMNAKKETERKAREENERKAKEAERREVDARAEAARKAKKEADAKAREEAEREAADWKAKEEADRKAKEEADRKAKEESDKREAELRAKEADRKAAAEQVEKKTKEEIARKAKELADKNVREEAAAKAARKAERRAAREEEERKTKEDEMSKRIKDDAKEEAEKKAKAAQHASGRKAAEAAAKKAKDVADKKEDDKAKEALKKVKEEEERKWNAETERLALEESTKRRKDDEVAAAAVSAAQLGSSLSRTRSSEQKRISLREAQAIARVGSKEKDLHRLMEDEDGLRGASMEKRNSAPKDEKKEKKEKDKHRSSSKQLLQQSPSAPIIPRPVLITSPPLSTSATMISMPALFPDPSLQPPLLSRSPRKTSLATAHPPNSLMAVARSPDGPPSSSEWEKGTPGLSPRGALPVSPRRHSREHSHGSSSSHHHDKNKEKDEMRKSSSFRQADIERITAMAEGKSTSLPALMEPDEHAHRGKDKDDSSHSSSSHKDHGHAASTKSSKSSSMRSSAATFDDDSSVSSVGRSKEKEKDDASSSSHKDASVKEHASHGSGRQLEGLKRMPSTSVHKRSKSMAVSVSHSPPPSHHGITPIAASVMMPSYSHSNPNSPLLRSSDAEKASRHRRRASGAFPALTGKSDKESNKHKPKTKEQKIILVQSLVRRWRERRRFRRALKKKRVVEEMWTSEKVYVERLGVLCELILKPLLRQTSKGSVPLLTRDQAQLIFCNVEAIHAHHRRFFGLLSLKVAKWNASARLGELYLSTDWVTLYRDFTEGKALSQRTLSELRAESPELDAFLKAREANSSLSSMLILPVQRITRYVMLLSEALKNTETNAEDYADLQRAAKHLGEACLKLEDNSVQKEDDKLRVGALMSLVRRFEDAEVKANQLLAGLATVPGRKICKEIEAMELDLADGKTQERVYILLSDALLIARGMGGKKLSLVRSAMLSATNVSAPTPAQIDRRFPGRAKMVLEFSFAHANKPFVLAFKTAEERDAVKSATNAAVLALSEASLGGQESWF